MSKYFATSGEESSPSFSSSEHNQLSTFSAIFLTLDNRDWTLEMPLKAGSWDQWSRIFYFLKFWCVLNWISSQALVLHSILNSIKYVKLWKCEIVCFNTSTCFNLIVIAITILMVVCNQDFLCGNFRSDPDLFDRCM